MPYMIMKCPTCKTLETHKTIGVEIDPKDGRKYQKHVCVKCKTVTSVYMNDDGSDFQENVDMPTDSDRDI